MKKLLPTLGFFTALSMGVFVLHAAAYAQQTDPNPLGVAAEAAIVDPLADTNVQDNPAPSDSLTVPTEEAPSEAAPEDPTEVIPTFDNDLSDLVPVEGSPPVPTETQYNPDGTPVVAEPVVAAPQPDLTNLPPDKLINTILTEELGNIYSDDVVVLPDFPSLLFLPGEHNSLEAAKATFVARPVTVDEVEDALEGGLDGPGGANGAPFIPAIREISLGGIMYNGDDDWIIWLNKQKITPGALPEEVMGLDVNKDYIELRWFDKQTNKIFPVRLRPNQRFNLDALLFLPG